MQRLLLDRTRRLTKPAQFRAIFAGSMRSADRYFTVLARANAGAPARLGLTISRRSAKRAVDRNRIKRIARETFRHQQLPAWDFVIIARNDAARAEKHALRASLDGHFARLRARAPADGPRHG